MYKSQWLLVTALLLSSCATPPAQITKPADGNVAEIPKKVEQSSKPKTLKGPIFQCHHGSDGVVVSCSALDCTDFSNTSNKQCSAIAQSLVSQSATGLIEFASKSDSDKGSMKITKRSYSGNSIVCKLTSDTPENKTRVKWAKYQENSCFLESY